MDFRQKLLDVHGETEFKGILLKHAQDLASEQSNPTRRIGNHEPEAEYEVVNQQTDWSTKLHSFFSSLSLSFSLTHPLVFGSLFLYPRSPDVTLHKDYVMTCDVALRTTWATMSMVSVNTGRLTYHTRQSTV